MKRRLHQSVTDWDSTDGGSGAPRCSAAVHRGVNYDPASLCGLAAPASPQPDLQSWSFSTSKPPSYRDRDQTQPKVGGYDDLSRRAQREPPLSPFSLPSACTTSHGRQAPRRTSLWPWQAKCAAPSMCPSVWNVHLCSNCKLRSGFRRQHRVPSSLNHSWRETSDSEVTPLTSSSFFVRRVNPRGAFIENTWLHKSVALNFSFSVRTGKKKKTTSSVFICLWKSRTFLYKWLPLCLLIPRVKLCKNLSFNTPMTWLLKNCKVHRKRVKASVIRARRSVVIADAWKRIGRFSLPH